MDDLIARVLSGEAGEFERRRLEEWRRESADNERHYRELAEVWDLSAPGERQRSVAAPPSVESIVAEAERRRLRIATAEPIRPGRIGRWWPLAAAAAVALAVGTPWALRTPERVYETRSGQTMTVPLPDGSVVRLGPESRLAVPRDGGRRARLAGLAFFAVASDSTRPFVVRTARGEVRVLGTRFELRVGEDSIRLVVVEGRVRLSGRGGGVEVGRGVVASIFGAAPPSVAQVTDVRSLLDWPGGLLVFQATPLSRVLEEIGARFGRPFVVRDSSLASLTVTAWFEDEPVEEVVNTVCLVVGARCVVGDTLEIGR